jgi:hypothetical protein
MVRLDSKRYLVFSILIFFCGLARFGHSLANVAYLCFLRNSGFEPRELAVTSMRMGGSNNQLLSISRNREWFGAQNVTSGKRSGQVSICTQKGTNKNPRHFTFTTWTYEKSKLIKFYHLGLQLSHPPISDGCQFIVTHFYSSAKTKTYIFSQHRLSMDSREFTDNVNSIFQGETVAHF